MHFKVKRRTLGSQDEDPLKEVKCSFHSSRVQTVIKTERHDAHSFSLMLFSDTAKENMNDETISIGWKIKDKNNLE